MRLKQRAKFGVALCITYIVVLTCLVYASEDLILFHMLFAIPPVMSLLLNWRNLFEASHG